MSTAQMRAARLKAALEEADGRLSPLGNVFAKVGEVLTWLIALTDLLNVSDPLLEGLRFARGRIIHGESPVSGDHAADIVEDDGTSAILGRAVLGRMRLGAGITLRWLPLDRIPEPKPAHRRGMQEYAAHVAGQEVFLSLHKAAILVLEECEKRFPA